MRAIVFILMTTVMMSCTSSTPVLNIEKANPSNLKTIVYDIAKDTASRNYLNTSKLDEVASYIQSKIDEYGYKCRLQEYLTNNGKYSNVVCNLDVDSKETVIIGAHYDSYGKTPGADDNASGVAGIIELARMLSVNKSSLKYDIELVAFTLEEPPYFRSEEMGSYIYAKSIEEHKAKVVATIILEMIGYFSTHYIQDYPLAIMKPFYPKHGNYIAAVSNLGSSRIASSYCEAMESINKLECQKLVGPSWIPGIDFSDHLNFWELGMDAIMITDTAFNRNKNYHTFFDTPESLDYVKMADVVNGVAKIILDGSL